MGFWLSDESVKNLRLRLSSSTHYRGLRAGGEANEMGHTSRPSHPVRNGLLEITLGWREIACLHK